MRNVFIVAGREISVLAKTKAFVAGTIIIALCIFVGVTIASAFSAAGPEAGANISNAVISNSVTQAKDANIQATSEVLESHGLSLAQFSQEVSEKTAQIIASQPKDVSNNSYWIGYVIAMVMYMMIVAVGAMIAQSVAEEKTSSIVEVLLASMSSRKLLAGKVTGMAALTFFQILIFLLSACAGLSVTGSFGVIVETLGGIGKVVPLLLICLAFLVIGFLGFASLYAAVAATVKRMQDVQAAIQPLVLVTVFVFIFSLLGGGPVGRVVNFIPLFSAFSAPAAFGRGDITLVETLISLVISVIFLPVIIWVAGKIYDNSILNSGGKVKIMKLLRQR